ncbi:MAG: cytochrome c [Chitinophagaceae bacterium]
MKKIIAIFFAVIGLNANINAQNAETGKALFGQNCTSCHAVGKQIVGPDLMNVDQQRSQDWIIHFVHSSQTVIKSGDTAAVRLYNEFNKTLMPDHPHLKDQDIVDIIAYIKDASVKAKDGAKASSLPAPPPMYAESNGSGLIHKIIFLDVNGNFHPMKWTNYFFWVSVGLMVIAIVAALLTAVKAQSMEDE